MQAINYNGHWDTNVYLCGNSICKEINYGKLQESKG